MHTHFFSVYEKTNKKKTLFFCGSFWYKTFCSLNNTADIIYVGSFNESFRQNYKLRSTARKLTILDQLIFFPNHPWRTYVSPVPQITFTSHDKQAYACQSYLSSNSTLLPHLTFQNFNFCVRRIFPKKFGKNNWYDKF